MTTVITISEFVGQDVCRAKFLIRSEEWILKTKTPVLRRGPCTY